MGTGVEGQAFLVVGAADGIGRAVAQRLAAGGARVVCVDRNAEGAETVARELPAESLAIPLDIVDVERVHGAVAQAVDWAGQLHGLVNCAGITGQTGSRTHDIPIDDFARVVSVNLQGAFTLTHALLPHLLENNYGRILHVASIAGKEGNAGMVSYSASKAGLIGMVKAQGKEYAESGITINALAPAVIRTAMVAAMPDEQVAYMTDKIPMKRCGTLEEAAEMVAWIVSPACSFTTGFAFDLTGGRAVY